MGKALGQRRNSERAGREEGLGAWGSGKSASAEFLVFFLTQAPSPKPRALLRAPRVHPGFSSVK